MTEPTKQYSWIIGLDNGCSANGVALLGPDNFASYLKLPTKNELSYTKEDRFITRIDAPGLRQLFVDWKLPKESTVVVMERMMINPARFRASISAARTLEAELIVIEELGYAYEYIDSKQWQHTLLPDIVGSDKLKPASLELAKRLYPQFKVKKDGDSMLIAHWYKHKDTLTPAPKPKKVKTL